MSIATRPAVGSPLPRLEDDRLLRGEGRYVGDLKRPRMLHAAFVRSAFPYALTAVDTGAARALPGVYAVYTADDFPDFGTFPYVGLGGEAVQIMRISARAIANALAAALGRHAERPFVPSRIWKELQHEHG